MYFKLCKSGFARSILEASDLDARTVLQALSYDKFLSDYEAAYLEINRQ